ncbi:MAG TPA: hypothetical protein PL192_06130 [Polynucleobacter sp.]|jgi:hypothetical protein|nr:hypothetical protein [Polynucleobacter sp.]
MSTAVFDNFAAPNQQPANFPYGIRIGSGNTNGINDIGIAGQRGFGVGICPRVPTGMGGLQGYNDPASDNYGNYQYSDGSVMVWIPAFYYKVGTGSNGLVLNKIDVKPFSAYADVATANAAGYALHRAFYDGGAIQEGFFYDKYITSNNNGIASSLRNGIVLTSAQRGSIANTAYSTLTGSPANTLGGSIAAAKTRGSNFFCASLFNFKAVALLSVAHAQAATATTYCSWYDASGVKNFPKGNNNNALGDAQDTAIVYVADGNGTYAGCGKTGSANLFSRTTHNGQNCGVADQNGLVYEFNPGLTSNGTDYFLLNTSVAMKSVTGSNTLATDLWGATGYAAMYTNIGTTYGPLWATGANRSFNMGSATQVLSEATSGTAWAIAGAGIPLATGIGGTNVFGNDTIYDYKPNEMAPLSGGGWNNSSVAGGWCLNLSGNRSTSSSTFGFRSALYL